MVSCMVIPRVRWRWVLPICQVLLAIGLVYMGSLEERTLRARAEERAAAILPERGAISFEPLTQSWGYVPLNDQIFIAIDFPVVLAVAPLKLIDLKSKLVGRVVKLTGVFLLWWWVGSGLDFRGKKSSDRRVAKAAIAILGLLISIGLGAAVIFSYWGHTPLGHFGGLLWCIYGAVFFANALRRNLPLRNKPVSGDAPH
jgi:hypothetical protein